MQHIGQETAEMLVGDGKLLEFEVFLLFLANNQTTSIAWSMPILAGAFLK
jgi:hypothetical protein